VEFLGGTWVWETTAVYVMSRNKSPVVIHDPRDIDNLWLFLERGYDVSRSLWDRESLIVHMDIDYVNFDYPGEPYLRPKRVFGIQQPVAGAVEEKLLYHDIIPLHLLSGRGHHFVWRVRQDSSAFMRLSELGRVPVSLKARYAKPHAPRNEIVKPEIGRAFAGLGLVMEFLAHCVIKDSAAQCEIPIELTAVKVGTGQKGSEIVSIDLSEYGDPIHLREVRIPFSIYLKPQRQRDILGEAFVKDMSPLFLIPLHEMDETIGIITMRDLNEIMHLARRASVKIPDQSLGMENLIAAYSESGLVRFHDWFYSQDHEPFWNWPQSYDRTPMYMLPPCAQRILRRPNDLLLKPAGIQHIVRTMLSLGWHPRHIAGLIRSKYERNYGWGGEWYHYDATSRADFYTRLFAGLFMAGVDDLVDFNCRSTQEKGYCFERECHTNLAEFRDPLLARRY
jgi:hypothetical protein